MHRPPIDSAQVDIKFVPYGYVAPPHLEGQNGVYVDVGNGLRVGVIDQHQLSTFTGASAELVSQHPDLIDLAIAPQFTSLGRFTIYVHEKPDFDCLLSTWLILKYLHLGSFPEGVNPLVYYSSQIDEGKLGAVKENPYSLYSAYMLLSNRLSMRRWNSPHDLYLRQITQGLDIIDYAYEQIRHHDASPLDINGFLTPGLFSPHDEQTIVNDIERYETKLKDPETKARQISLQLSGFLGGQRKVPALFVSNVQNIADPQRVIHFKDWARSDYARAGSTGFVFLSIYSSDKATGQNRCIISVKPGMQVYLKGLGQLLEEAECEQRSLRFGKDERCFKDDKPLPLRTGYNHPDPWYDGRGHQYTILDSPRAGTILSACEIETIILTYGQSQNHHFQSLNELMNDRNLSTSARLNMMTQLVQDNQEVTHPPPLNMSQAKIFISYAHLDQDWVIHHIYQPLVSIFGEELIFLDLASLKGGAAWLNTLAKTIESCRLFIPVYSTNFFNSDFCLWELHQAIIRDPIGKNKLILPLQMNQVVIPSWCSLVQSQDITDPYQVEQIAQQLYLEWSASPQ